MRLLVKHASSTSIDSIYSTATRLSSARGRLDSTHYVLKPWICQQCRQGSQTFGRFLPHLRNQGSVNYFEKRGLLYRQRAKLPKVVARRLSTETQSKIEQYGDHNPAKATRKELPSQEEGRRSHVSRRFTHLMDHLQSNIFIAGQRLNDLTGYSGIEALKKDIEEQEKLVQSTRLSLQDAKEAYSQAISQRSTSQREVNELLQRKHAWTGADLERFTSLYRSDHTNEQSETAAQEALTTAEREAEEAAGKLSASILARYHEEQIWSDKIRRMSTWGTWGLMGVNVLLFLVFQIGVEPWRRKRLVKGFEEKVMEALEREGAATNAATGAALAALQASHSKQAGNIERAETPEPSMATPVDMEAVEKVEPSQSNPEVEITPLGASDKSMSTAAWHRVVQIFSSSQGKVEDLFSDRPILLRRVDITAATLEGTLYGIMLASIVAAFVRSR